MDIGDIYGFGRGVHLDETYVHMQQREGRGEGRRHWYNTYVYVHVCEAELFQARGR